VPRGSPRSNRPRARRSRISGRWPADPYLNGRPGTDFGSTVTSPTPGLAASINVTQGGNLELHLFTLSGNTLVALGSATQTAAAPATISVSAGVAAGQAILVEIKGLNSSPRVQDSGDYNLVAKLQ